MGDYGINLRRIGTGGDDRPFMVKMRVPWIFNTTIGKAYLIATSFISIYTVGRLIYSLYVRFS